MDQAPGSSGDDRRLASVIDRALAAYGVLAELGESVADEWQYVNDLVAVHSADLAGSGTPDAGRVLLGLAAVGAVDLAIEEIGLITDPHRAIDWLSTFPQIVRLAVAPRRRAPDVRFQAAALDGRAIVYAGIQADPLVGRVAGLLADATAAELVLARAVMNGERTEPDVWRGDVPRALRRRRPSAGAGRPGRQDARRAAARRQPRGRRAWRAVAQPVPRRDRRGADRATARASGSARGIRRERRVLFDGVAAEIHPYDVTVELPTRAEVYDCKWGARGINADVLHQLDDARRHAADEEQKLFVALVIFDSRRSAEVRLARLTAPRHGDAAVHSGDPLRARLAGTPEAADRRRSCCRV